MNTDQDLRELLERMARETAILPVDPEPILRRAHRRLARTAVLGLACIAVAAAVAIGGANLLSSSAPVPATPNPTEEEPNGGLPPILREGEVLVQDLGTGRLEALDPSTGDQRTILDCEDWCGLILRRGISADRRWLAYEVLCVRPCPPEEIGIWMTNALGDERRLTKNVLAWAWSPRGSTIAAMVGEVSQLLTIDPATGDQTTVASSFVDALAWSPDGTDIVYAAAGLESVDLASGEISELVADTGAVHSIAWSPDGSRIVFDETQHDRDRIILINADGSAQRVLVERLSGNQGIESPAWSPDGTRIAYVSSPGSNASGFTHDLWVIGADGSNATFLFEGDCCLNDWRGPVWSPDGSRIALNEGDGWIVVNADGTGSPEQIDEAEVQTW